MEKEESYYQEALEARAEHQHITEVAEESYLIDGALYLIIPQASGGYAVKVTDTSIVPAFDAYWVKTPERRYETLAGARYAILLNLSSASF